MKNTEETKGDSCVRSTCIPSQQLSVQGSCPGLRLVCMLQGATGTQGAYISLNSVMTTAICLRFKRKGHKLQHLEPEEHCEPPQARSPAGQVGLWRRWNDRHQIPCRLHPLMRPPWCQRSWGLQADLLPARSRLRPCLDLQKPAIQMPMQVTYTGSLLVLWSGSRLSCTATCQSTMCSLCHCARVSTV